jgi:hypothetical protein
VKHSRTRPIRPARRRPLREFAPPLLGGVVVLVAAQRDLLAPAVEEMFTQPHEFRLDCVPNDPLTFGW